MYKRGADRKPAPNCDNPAIYVIKVSRPIRSFPRDESVDNKAHQVRHVLVGRAGDEITVAVYGRENSLAAGVGDVVLHAPRRGEGVPFRDVGLNEHGMSPVDGGDEGVAAHLMGDKLAYIGVTAEGIGGVMPDDDDGVELLAGCILRCHIGLCRAEDITVFAVLTLLVGHDEDRCAVVTQTVDGILDLRVFVAVVDNDGNAFPLEILVVLLF